LRIGDGAADYALARIAVAARAYGLQPIDGPFAALEDDGGLVDSARRALAHGYDGKWVVHPRQIEAVKDVFTPLPEDVARARAILEASEGASRLGAEMVDEASRRLAESLLARADVPETEHVVSAPAVGGRR